MQPAHSVHVHGTLALKPVRSSTPLGHAPDPGAVKTARNAEMASSRKITWKIENIVMPTESGAPGMMMLLMGDPVSSKNGDEEEDGCDDEEGCELVYD